MTMKFRRFLFSRLYRKPEPGDDGGGFTDTSTDTQVDPGQVDTTPATGAETAQPLTMHEAMFPTAQPLEGETQAQAEQRVRDEKGRFATKPPVDPTAVVDPLKKPVEIKDPSAMPEGLTPKAQQRFQELANTNKELTTQLAQATQLAGSPEAVIPMLQSAQAMQQTFRDNGVTRDQFEQATGVIGLINRGDMAGAQKILEDQLRQIALITGVAPGQIDPLSSFPDLREAVDNLQLDEGRALELARARTTQHHQQQGQRQQQEQQRSQQAEQQEVHAGQQAVDRFCQGKLAGDLDWVRIEPLLLKEVREGLLQGVPPQHWARIVEKTYGLIKQSASSARTAPSTQVLRPTGVDSPRAAPKSAYEAMWGAQRPAGM